MENFNAILENANNGDALSQYKVGRAYESGDGVEKNLSVAREWYQKSADNGYKNAEVKLKLMPVQEATCNVAETPEPPKTAYQPPVAPNVITANGETKAPYGISDKSKTVAAVLAFLFGYIGVHDFYLGYIKQGIIKILLTITGIGTLISMPWALIDMIKILCNGKTDSKGQLLK